MAARLNLRQQYTVRNHIKTTQLVKRLQDHVDGVVKLDASQIKAIEILIRKTLPDLKAVEHSGNEGKAAPEDMTNAELAAELHRVRTAIARNLEAAGSDDQPAEVH